MNYASLVLWTLAWRNLWRNYRRTLIMLTAITVGVWAMIFMTALLRGMVDEMVRTSTSTLLGHVQIHHQLYIDDPNIANSMEPPTPAMISVLERDPLAAWTTRVRLPAVISSEREAAGVMLVGIDPDREAAMSFIQDAVIEGRYLNSPNDKGVILGARLVERLDTSLGKRIVLMSQDPDNNIVDRGFRIVGIYHTDPASTESRFAFLGLHQAQSLLNLGNKISELEILGQDYRETRPIVERLQKQLPAQQQVNSWTQLNAYMGSMLAVMDGFILIWIVVVFLALSFGLVNTLAMAVFERVREIGLMLALGMRPAAIMLQVLIESLVLLLLGLVLGNLLAWLSLIPLQDGIDISSVGEGLEMAGMSSILTPSLRVEDMVTATLVVVCLGVLASLFPAWKASRYDPVQALTKI